MSGDFGDVPGALWILPSAPDKQTGLLEVGLLLIDVLLDGLGFKSDSERRAEIENHASAIRRRYLNEASTGDQIESADELDEAAASLVSDRVTDPVVDDGGDLTRHDSSPSLDARSGAGHTASVGAGPACCGESAGSGHPNP